MFRDDMGAEREQTTFGSYPRHPPFEHQRERATSETRRPAPPLISGSVTSILAYGARAAQHRDRDSVPRLRLDGGRQPAAQPRRELARNPRARLWTPRPSGRRPPPDR